MSETETQVVMDNETVVNDAAEAVAEQMPEEVSAEDVIDTSMAFGEADFSESSTMIREGAETVEAAGPRAVHLPNTREMQRILNLHVPIIVRLAQKVLSLGEITQFTPGVIIEFNKEVGEKLDLMINNKCIGNGEAVKVGEKFGLKVTSVGSLEQMIKAMGT
jgi:flagellar motor switch protein FliN/FliY